MYEISMEADKKVGDMTLTQLMTGLSTLLEDKLDEKLSKLATKDDISDINDKVNALVAENESLREQVIALKLQGRTAHERLLDLEGRSRRNNLIFKGLQWNGKRPDCKEIILNFCRDVMGCADKIWINRAHPVGRDGKSIIAHIPEDSDINYILSHTSKLKGTGYVIHRDFPHEVRVKRSFLVKVRSEIDRVAGGLRMPLVHDHLYVKGRKFTWEAGKLRAGAINGAQELRSLFRHDFTEFLDGLSRRECENREVLAGATSQTNAKAAAQEQVRTTSQESKQSTSQGHPSTAWQKTLQITAEIHQAGDETPTPTPQTAA